MDYIFFCTIFEREQTRSQEIRLNKYTASPLNKHTAISLSKYTAIGLNKYTANPTNKYTAIRNNKCLYTAIPLHKYIYQL